MKSKNTLYSLSNTISFGVIFSILVGIFLGIREAFQNRFLHFQLDNLFYATVNDHLVNIIIPALLFSVVFWMLNQLLKHKFTSGFIQKARMIYSSLAGILFILIEGFYLNRYTLKSHWAKENFREIFSLNIPEGLINLKVWGYNSLVILFGVGLGFLTYFIFLFILKRIYSDRLKKGLLFTAGALLLCFILFYSTSKYVFSSVMRDTISKPNIILISIDTLRADHLHCYGYGQETSPNIDKIAKEGFLFKNHIAQTNWTLPSHASIFTSQYPTRHTAIFTSRKIPKAKVTITEILRNAGLRTAGFTGGYNVDKRFNFDQGFQEYHGDTVGYLMTRSKRIGKGMRFADRAGEVFTWLEKNKDCRFFLFLHAYDTHAPYVPHKRIIEKFGPFPDGRIKMLSHRITQEYNRGDLKLSEKDLTRIKSLYDNEIYFVDQYIGHLSEKLKQLHLYENTILIITSDHGDELGEHSRLGHGHTLFDNEIHIPLIIRIPGDEGGGTIESQTMSIDIFPTMINLLKIEVSEEIHKETQGRPLPNRLHANSNDHYMVFSESVHPKERLLAGRTLENKIILQQIISDYPIGDTSFEDKMYFDLSKDPSELTNIINNKSDRYYELKRRLYKWNEDQKKLLELAPGVEEHTLDPDLERKLKALGYLR